MAEYKKTFGEFGIGLTPNWKEKQCAPGHIVLEAFGYDIHFFPFSLEGEKVAVCPLVLEHRTTTSPRYHPRPRVFDEYVFPEEPEWFGAYIALVKSGVEVADPGIVYANENGIRSFTTNAGHQVRLFVAEKGDTKQLFNVDPVLIRSQDWEGTGNALICYHRCAGAGGISPLWLYRVQGAFQRPSFSM